VPESIGRLDRLRRLHLSSTSVKGLEPVSQLAGLTSLWLNRTGVTDLDPLARLTGLKWLGLRDRVATDLGPLAGLKGLKELWLDRTSVTGPGFAPLEHMDALEVLHAERTGVVDLKPLQGMKRLNYLWLKGTPVSQISALSKLKSLRKLALTDTLVTDVSALEELTEMEALWLNRTKVSDLGPLKKLTSLRALGIDGTSISDLRPVRRFEKLVSEYEYEGLSISGSTACADPRIAEIAAIPDPKARAQALFDLIDAGWEPPAPLGERQAYRDAGPIVFLSYASADRERAAAIHRLLSAQGIPLWWDQDIPPGAPWRETIAARLDLATVVLTLWTAESSTRKAVIEEAARAQAAGTLVHARLDDVVLPYGFAETQYADLRGWDGTPTHPEMRKLLQALRDKMNPPDRRAMEARLTAASPVAMVVESGLLSPRDTPPNVEPSVVNAPDLGARIEGIRQMVTQRRAEIAAGGLQVPPDLDRALASVASAAAAERPTWYAFEDARETLRDCMTVHDAWNAWNTVLVLGLERICDSITALQPLLQPRQVPPDQPGAKPPEPDPVVRRADTRIVVEIVSAVRETVATTEAEAVLAPEALDLVARQADALAEAAREPDEERRPGRLRRALRALGYTTGAIIVAVGGGVPVALLTAPEAAATLALRLRQAYDQIVSFFR
jgi:hypothetical protein